MQIYEKNVVLQNFLFLEKKRDLLYFREYSAGRVRVACSLLYSIFNVGWGLLYFSVRFRL